MARFFCDIDRRTAWLCDTEVAPKQGDKIAVVCDGQPIMFGEVINRFPRLKRRLRIKYYDPDVGGYEINRVFSRELSERFMVGVAVAVHTFFK